MKQEPVLICCNSFLILLFSSGVLGDYFHAIKIAVMKKPKETLTTRNMRKTYYARADIIATKEDRENELVRRSENLARQFIWFNFTWSSSTLGTNEEVEKREPRKEHFSYRNSFWRKLYFSYTRYWIFRWGVGIGDLAFTLSWACGWVRFQVRRELFDKYVFGRSALRPKGWWKVLLVKSPRFISRHFCLQIRCITYNISIFV